jgi:Family of unknown function (DUF6448)
VAGARLDLSERHRHRLTRITSRTGFLGSAGGLASATGIAAFAAVMPVRALSDQAQAVADRLFFQTVVRIHRAWEGAPYTGLKPAGTPVGPVIPIAEEPLPLGPANG